MFIRQILQSVQYRAWMLWQWIKENKKTFFVRTTVLAVIIVSIFWFFFRTYHNYEVIDSMKRQSDMSANYFFSEKGTLCYSKDGVSFANNKGTIIWNQVFGMESPKMDHCDDYIAIGDIGANSM